MKIRKLLVAGLAAFAMIFSTMSVISLTSVNVMATDSSPDPDPEVPDDPRNPDNTKINKIAIKHATGTIDCYNLVTNNEYTMDFEKLPSDKKAGDTIDFYLSYSQYQGLSLKYESFNQEGTSNGIKDVTWDNGKIKVPLTVYEGDETYESDSFVIYVQDTTSPGCAASSNNGGSSTSGQKSSTNTGTQSNVTLYAGLAGACIIGIGAIVFLKKKEN